MNRFTFSKPLPVFAVVLLAIAAVMAATPAQAQVDFAVCAGSTPGSITEDCLSLMAAFPSPTVIDVPLDKYTISNYSFYKVSEGAAVFDAPGGGVVRNFPQGFHFVRALNFADGWVQIEDGGWMQEGDLSYSPASDLTGVRILDGLSNQFAWALGLMCTSPAPGAQQNCETGRLIKRFDRLNIFAQVEDADGWRWYMVGPDQWVEQRVVAKPVLTERPEGFEGRWVSVDLYEQVLVAYENDTPIFATVISTGLPGTETREGAFKVWAALPSDRMSGFAGAPNAYDLSSVPWVQYFDGSISLHGTYWHNNFGYRRSRGCVNLSISDARWLFEWAVEGNQAPRNNAPVEDATGLGVLVWASGEYRVGGAATK
jgi:hypothetical protein